MARLFNPTVRFLDLIARFLDPTVRLLGLTTRLLDPTVRLPDPIVRFFDPVVRLTARTARWVNPVAGWIDVISRFGRVTAVFDATKAAAFGGKGPSKERDAALCRDAATHQ
jgi:hypothetical protein